MHYDACTLKDLKKRKNKKKATNQQTEKPTHKHHLPKTNNKNPTTLYSSSNLLRWILTVGLIQLKSRKEPSQHIPQALYAHSYHLPHGGGRTHVAEHKGELNHPKNDFCTVHFSDSSAPLSDWPHIWLSACAYIKDAAEMHSFHPRCTIRAAIPIVKLQHEKTITLESNDAP